MTAGTADVVDSRTVWGTTVVRLPALVRGELVRPPWPTVGDVTRLLRRDAADGHEAAPVATGEAYLLRRPVVDRERLSPTGELAVLVLPAVAPRSLPEPDPARAVTELMRLTGTDVAQLVATVRTALLDGAHDLLPLLTLGSTLGDRAHRAVAAQLPLLFDPDTVARCIARALPGGDSSRWVEVDETAVAGTVTRMAGISSPARRPTRCAVPTRQLHVTAGNAAVVPLASLLWGWCSRGACVVKASADVCAVPAVVGAAIAAAAPDHPLARHTTLVYWPGGDRAVEDVVLAPGAFDRRLVWGSQETVESIAHRGGGTETIIMHPRHSVSLISASALGADLSAVVAAAAADSLVANQAACMSSLCHVVLGSGPDADRYAAALHDELARWDERLPYRPDPEARRRLLAWRRGALAGGRWLVAGSAAEPRSVVVRHDGYVDLRRHPGARLVVVAAVPDVPAFLRRLGPDVSSVGVWPESLRAEVRDAVVACGVDNVLPLGAAEEGYPGRPHDGMDVLPRLVRWVNG